MPIIGIAKRLRKLFPGDSYPIHMIKNRKGLRYFNGLETKSPVFAITFHPNVRKQNALRHQLTGYSQSIGWKTADKLLVILNLVKKINEASEDEISKIIGASKGKALSMERKKIKGGF